MGAKQAAESAPLAQLDGCGSTLFGKSHAEQLAELTPIQAARAISSAVERKEGRPVNENWFSSCPRYKGAWLISREPEPRAVQSRCRSWKCPFCSRLLSLCAVAVLADGCAKAQADGRQVRFITLTDRAEGKMDIEGLYRSWQKLTLRLKRRDLLGEFAYSVELQPKRKAVHIHALLSESQRGGGYIDARELSKLALASGFGKIVKIKMVEKAGKPGQNLAEYLDPSKPKLESVQNVARYCTKSSALELAAKSGQRIRPFRTSRNWPGGGLRNAADQLAETWYGAKPDNITWEFWHESYCQEQMVRLERISRAIKQSYEYHFPQEASLAA